MIMECTMSNSAVNDDYNCNQSQPLDNQIYQQNLMNQHCQSVHQQELLCACQSCGSKPIDYLGDNVCRPQVSLVREIIKKYEQPSYPDGPKRNSNVHNIKPMKTYRTCSRQNSAQTQTILLNNHPQLSNGNYKELINNHLVYDEQAPPMEESLEEVVAGNNIYRLAEQIPCPAQRTSQSLPHCSHSGSYLVQKQSTINEECPTCRNSKSSSFCNLAPNKICSRSSDISYQSKTTISKTPSGVRITTDIFFDSHPDREWYGSRIETDIPPSRILKEFQEKNFQGRI